MFKIFKSKNQSISDNLCFEQICTALKEVMPEENRNKELSASTKIESLGIDSIKYINLFISIEEIVGKDLEEIVDSIDLSTINTIEDIVKLVAELQIK